MSEASIPLPKPKPLEVTPTTATLRRVEYPVSVPVALALMVIYASPLTETRVGVRAMSRLLKSEASRGVKVNRLLHFYA